MKFLMRHTRFFFNLALVMFVATACLMVTGCGVPTWLQDANQIVGLVGTSITAIGAFIAGLTGNAALSEALGVISVWIQKIQTGITDLETLITQYNQSPTPTLLQDIEQALADVQTNLQQDFSNLGLPSSILSVIAGVAGLALSQLQAWGSLIPAMKANAMQSVVLKVPYSSAQFKQQVNLILSTQTGDPEVDAALARVHKLK